MKDNANGHWNKKHGSWHHIISRSIGGPNVPENKYLWIQEKHAAYHRLFYNYLPSIVIGIINLWTDQNDNLKLQLMGKRNIQAWQEVFDGASPSQAVKFIRKNFLPIESKFLRGELGGEYEKEK